MRIVVGVDEDIDVGPVVEEKTGSGVNSHGERDKMIVVFQCTSGFHKAQKQSQNNVSPDGDICRLYCGLIWSIDARLYYVCVVSSPKVVRNIPCRIYRAVYGAVPNRTEL